MVVLFFDASQRIVNVDKQLCNYIAQEYRPCIFAVNKWDLMADTMPTEKWVAYLRDTFRSMTYVPIAFIAGQTGKNVKALLNHAQKLFRQSQTRIGTGPLNKVVETALRRVPPPLYRNRRPKIYFATQVAGAPPAIVLFCNEPKAIGPTYQRYLLGVFRDYLGFTEVPIKLYLRRREHSEKGDRPERGEQPEGSDGTDEEPED